MLTACCSCSLSGHLVPMAGMVSVIARALHLTTLIIVTLLIGGPEPIVVGFFFWAPGTELQKSLSGLQRALLHDALHQRPGLIPVVLPDLWQQARSRPWQIQGTGAESDISESRIRKAIEHLVNLSSSIAHQCCLCLFIDGLDEFHATPAYDTSDMIGDLKRWAAQSPEHVKICVSSREEPQFMTAFSPVTRFRLHELTATDIKTYIDQRLSPVLSGLSKQESDNLVSIIVTKAEGVFLWVSLAVSSVREQAANGARLVELVAEVHDLKSDMIQLFEQIIASIARSGLNLRRLHQTATLVALTHEGDGKYEIDPFSLFEFSCLGLYESNSSFSVDLTVEETDIDHLIYLLIYSAKNQKRTQSIVDALANVNRCCRGLFQYNIQLHRAPIEYAHRSIAEFFGAPDLRRRVAQGTEGFDCLEFLSQAALAAVKLYSKFHGNGTGRRLTS
jgi:hypothetical protein